MNDHIPVFSGLKTKPEPHLLQPGELRQASNIRVNSGQARTRTGLIPILHFAHLDTDYKLLWPTSLPWIPVRNVDYTATETRYSQDPFTSFISFRSLASYPLYPARRANLADFFNGRGGSADCQVLSDRRALQSRTDKYTWEATHFSYE
ncbi:MAG TPA: hypothetical protein DCZ94_21525 [Lentisphaeria bacterium]|nr:MAG: hypothetical protein A2X48_14455 [Lentisphaerae bacterium GWF2_49_21]HBC89526.1 hypothetical protein [Lentisphaeria bacterium]